MSLLFVMRVDALRQSLSIFLTLRRKRRGSFCLVSLSSLSVFLIVLIVRRVRVSRPLFILLVAILVVLLKIRLSRLRLLSVRILILSRRRILCLCLRLRVLRFGIWGLIFIFRSLLIAFVCCVISRFSVSLLLGISLRRVVLLRMSHIVQGVVILLISHLDDKARRGGSTRRK